jgi:predicted regulator of Ras-like GTPase activity (Roadblock/LC7/MglB family)
MRLTTLWRTVKRSRRVPTRTEMFRAASRERDAGRLDVALELVTKALVAEPNSIVGHLLVGNLHLATRAMTPARDAFQRVLERDAHQPRALLGLARVAFEEHDTSACRAFLERAIARYPEFPEAQALLEVLTTPVHTTAPTLSPRDVPLPHGASALMVLGADGTVITARPDAGAGREAAHVHRISRLANAILERARLGALREAVIDDGAHTTVLRASDSLALAVTFAGDVDLEAATLDVYHVWETVHADATTEVAPA